MEQEQEQGPRSAVEILAASILEKRNVAVYHRAATGVERRWLEDEAALDGLDSNSAKKPMVEYATGETLPREAKRVTNRSQVIVNIIRGKCEQTEGRFADIQFPVDDRNWGLKTTPIPELVNQAKSDKPVVMQGQPVMNEGKQVTMGDLAANELKIAQEKMEAMQTEIDDKLNECGFNGECRKALKNAVRKGTGILKGPGVVKQLRKAWVLDENSEDEWVLKVLEEHKPFSKSIDPWKVYPDPECKDDIKRAGHIWEQDFILPRELRQLKGVDGYIESQIDLILKEKPLRTQVATKDDKMVNMVPVEKLSAFEMWEYNGDLSVAELEALDCDCTDMGVDLSGNVSACVIFVNERPIKAVLNLLDTGDLPYDFFQWTTVADSVFGIGLPRILIWQQRVITAAWRMMMDNGRNSTRGHIIKGDGLQMVDNTGPYTEWEATGDMDDVRKAFGIHYFPNNQADLQNIIELALKFTDLETAMPMAFAGEQVGPAETLGAVELKVDSSNVALRGRVKLWDDQITRPHITRYYHWEMQYSENNDAKGDYNVDPRGVSVLLVKDQAARTIMDLMQLREDPVIGGIIDWVKAVKQMLAAQNVDILKSDEEIEAALKKIEEGPQEVDPRTQIVQLQSETTLKKTEMEQSSNQAKFKAEQEITGAKLQRQEEENERGRQHDMKLELVKRDNLILTLAAQEKKSVGEIKADLAGTAMKLNLQKELSVGKGSTEVATPPMEPAGRAEDGRSFEQ